MNKLFSLLPIQLPIDYPNDAININKDNYINYQEEHMPEHISLYKLFEMSEAGRWNAYCQEIVLPLIGLHYGSIDTKAQIDTTEKNILKLMWHVYNLDELDTLDHRTVLHILRRAGRQNNQHKKRRARAAVELLIMIFFRLQENPLGLYKADLHHFQAVIQWLKETSLGIIKDYNRDRFSHRQYSLNASRIENLLSDERTRLHHHIRETFEVVEQRCEHTLYLIFERGEKVEIFKDTSVGAKHLRRRLGNAVDDWHEEDQFHFLQRDKQWILQPNPFSAPTFVNGEQISGEYILAEGDNIIVGTTDSADFRILFHSGTILTPLPQDDSQKLGATQIRATAFLEEVLFPLMQEGVTLQEQKIASYLLSIYGIKQVQEEDWITVCKQITNKPRPVLRQESFALFAQWMYRVHTSSKVWDTDMHDQLLHLFFVPISQNHDQHFSKKMEDIKDLNTLINYANEQLRKHH